MSINARESVCARKGTWASGVQVTQGSTQTMSEAPRNARVTLAARCRGSTSFQLLRSKVKRRASAYTGGVKSDHTKEMVIFQASSCAQLSGLPMDAVYTCAPAALRKASTVQSTKPMAHTRPHCFNMVSYLILRSSPKK